MKLWVQVVLSWDRQATLELLPEITVHELLLRAQDVLQHNILALTSSTGRVLPGLDMA